MLRAVSMGGQVPSRRVQLLTGTLRAAGAALTATMLAAAFLPSRQPEAAWFALVPMLVLCRFAPPAVAFRWGLLAGAGFWLISLAWLLRLAATGTVWPLAALGWILLALYCALYTAVFAAGAAVLFRWREGGVEAGGGCARAMRGEGEDDDEEEDEDEEDERAEELFARRRRRGLALVAALPILWVGTEYGRATLLTGFPWNGLGVSQYRNLVIVQLADWGGVYAVSGLLVVMNAALALVVVRMIELRRDRQRRRGLQLELMAALLVTALALSYGFRRLHALGQDAPQGPEVRIAAVQPNIPQVKKWTAEAADEIFASLGAQTERALVLKPDLVVWPETALPAAVAVGPDGGLRAEPSCAGLLRDLFAGRETALLAGAMERYGPDDAPVWYNSSVLLADGRLRGCYRKRHLVPFGEYLPFDRHVALIRRLAPLGFSCTPGDAPGVLALARPEVRLAPLICFEDIIPGLARAAVRAGAQILVNQTNDAWFDPGSASLQHMCHGVFRSVENRAPTVRAANTGVTCVIDRRGRIEFMGIDAAVRRPGFKCAWVAGRAGDEPLTLYTRFGDALCGLPCAALTAAALAGAGVRAWRRRRAAPPPRPA